MGGWGVQLVHCSGAQKVRCHVRGAENGRTNQDGKERDEETRKIVFASPYKTLVNLAQRKLLKTLLCLNPLPGHFNIS